MYTQIYEEKHPLGLERLTGSNRGLFFTNEQPAKYINPSTGREKNGWQYDIYEIDDARNKGKVKNSVVEETHPFGDETKILRKTLAKVLQALDLYDTEEYAEFKNYNEFVEGV